MFKSECVSMQSDKRRLVKKNNFVFKITNKDYFQIIVFDVTTRDYSHTLYIFKVK